MDNWRVLFVMLFRDTDEIFYKKFYITLMDLSEHLVSYVKTEHHKTNIKILKINIIIKVLVEPIATLKEKVQPKKQTTKAFWNEFGKNYLSFNKCTCHSW